MPAVPNLIAPWAGSLPSGLRPPTGSSSGYWGPLLNAMSGVLSTIIGHFPRKVVKFLKH